MATHNLDYRGLKCPEPVLKLAVFAKQQAQPGDIVEILSDCDTFPQSIEGWCKKSGKTLLLCVDEGGGQFKAQVQL
ncbi:MAG: sulfurtransferase TusA family protein [Dehalococcoidia bacterium]